MYISMYEGIYCTYILYLYKIYTWSVTFSYAAFYVFHAEFVGIYIIRRTKYLVKCQTSHLVHLPLPHELRYRIIPAR